MTPAVASLFKQLALDRLAAIRSEEAGLIAGLAELGVDVPALTPAFRAGVEQLRQQAEAEPPAEARQETPPPASPLSPLAARRLELMEEHGSMYVVEPSVPVTVGQKTPYGKSPPKTVEIIESAAHLADENGRCVPNRWFAKLVDI